MFIVRMAWRSFFEPHCRTANRKCQALPNSLWQFMMTVQDCLKMNCNFNFQHPSGLPKYFSHQQYCATEKLYHHLCSHPSVSGDETHLQYTVRKLKAGEPKNNFFPTSEEKWQNKNLDLLRCFVKLASTYNVGLNSYTALPWVIGKLGAGHPRFFLLLL